MVEISDHELVSRANGGSGVAFEILMRRYEKLVYRVAFGFTGEREGALDVTQSVFLAVHSRLANWRREGELRSWIARIATNESLNWSRRERRHRHGEPGEQRDPDVLLPDPPQNEEARRRDRQRILWRSLSELPPKQRSAVVLRYFHDLTGREMAQVLECTEGTARNLLFRGLQRLRALLGDDKEALS